LQTLHGNPNFCSFAELRRVIVTFVITPRVKIVPAVATAVVANVLTIVGGLFSAILFSKLKMPKKNNTMLGNFCSQHLDNPNRLQLVFYCEDML
jgi:hypothetical protein